MEDIVSALKLFYEKIWFWLVISVCSWLALFYEKFLNWLGINSDKRWIVGIVAVFSFALAIQQICDWIREYIEHKRIIKNIDYLTVPSLKELKCIVKNNKKTLHIKSNDNLEQRRIIAHFNLPINDEYVTFPDYLWKILKKKFGEK